MPNTLIPIQTYTLVSAASSITFANIPQSYTDLKVVASLRANSTQNWGDITFNGGGTAISMRHVLNNSGSAISQAYSPLRFQCNTDSYTANTFSSAEMYVVNYTSSNAKSVLMDGTQENSSSSTGQHIAGGLWNSSSAVTSITITPDGGGTFVIGSTVTLYGVSNGVKATGGTLTVAGGYAYHTFTSTGSFFPNQQIKSAEVLVVAGGGGGCGYGAGGAGGLSYKFSSTLTVGSYPITVGSGGSSAGSSGGAAGGTGTNSTFAGVTSLGGGGGRTGNTGLSGGSGAGGSYNNNAAGAATQGSTGGAIGYGNAGGDGYTNNSTIFNAGGGGGAGGAGSAGTANPPDGGVGLNTWALWANATGTGSNGYYAGGGGGCSRQTGNYPRGGLGGGGVGGNRNLSAVAGAATANTGGGGGAGDDDQGGAGASGIVIIRYPIS
jgi:hypothetical protein